MNAQEIIEPLQEAHNWEVNSGKRLSQDFWETEYRRIVDATNVAIAQAVAAEREACAKIAEKRSSGLTHAELEASKITARAIAAEIRARNGAQTGAGGSK